MSGLDYELIDQMLAQLRRTKIAPSWVRDGERDILYFIIRTGPDRWIVRKTIDGHVLLLEYDVWPDQPWCSCPAGMNGKICKHLTWVIDLELALAEEERT